MKPSNHLKYYLALISIHGLGPASFLKLQQTVSSLEEIFNFSESYLQQLGLSKEQANQIKTFDWRQVDQTLCWAEEERHHIITIDDEAYPILLKDTVRPPIVLFVIGDPALLSTPQLAIVGSRHPTSVGRDNAKQFAEYLAKHNFTITSGLALGVDGASHEGALKTGKTIAVLGTGLDCIYPARHHELAARIIENGALVSEFSLGTRIAAENFPRRNRIISGLSLGTLVVEAAIRSGSLITAHYAVEQGREVFAVPGSIHNPLAKGCHKLLREGAKLVEQASDILEELGALSAVLHAERDREPLFTGPRSVLDQEYQDLLSCVEEAPTSLPLILRRSALKPEVLSTMLLQLELEGFIKSAPGGYCRVGFTTA